MPGTPTSVRSCGVRSCRARSKASRTTLSSRSRPTSSARASWATSTPKREWAVWACHTAIGSALPFASTGFGVLVVDSVTRCPVRRLVDQHTVDGRGALEARGGVHDVPGGHALAGIRLCIELHKRLAGRDPHTQLEPFVDRELANGERRPHRALGVVLVRDGRAEQRHDGVADELLDRTAVAFELGSNAGVVRTENRRHVLGIQGLRLPREADEVAEDDGDDLAFRARLAHPVAACASSASPRST